MEAEAEWEYHLPTELERGIVRENRVARENTVRTMFPAVQGRALVQCAAWDEQAVYGWPLMIHSHSRD